MSDSSRPSKKDIVAHYDAIAAGYEKQYDKDAIYTLEKYPANYFRLKNLVSRLSDLNAKRVYEVGTGEGSPLVTIAKMGFDVAGCDISENMVSETQKKLVNMGLSQDQCRLGDIESFDSISSQKSGGDFDVAFAFGVLPHVNDDLLTLQNMRKLLTSDGRVFVEFRNKVFSLFTFNRLTKKFIIEDILSGVDASVRDAVSEDLDKRLAMDQPVSRDTIADGQPGYDAIVANYHNPFEIPDLFEKAGFKNPRIHWYHYHPAPPMLEKNMKKEFRSAGIEMEGNTSDWRGYFLCSAGVVEAEVA